MHTLMLFIHSFNKYCAYSQYVPGTLLCPLDRVVNKADMILAQDDDTVKWRKRSTKMCNLIKYGNF